MPTSESRGALAAEIVDSTRRVIASSILFSHHVAEQLGLGASDSQFMTLLEVHGPLTPGRLAELTGLRTGTVTGVLDRLEQAGFIRRDRVPGDRRKVIVSRDEEQIQRRIAPLYAGQGARVSAILDEYDTAQLRLIAGFMRKVAGDGPGDGGG
ncbi:MarR family winged helix-turn-helix transcriptional regulator [Sphaerisporangium dianthi]|uniref:MarR family winged helix-turn-helix transcriptional regulator n=1 Tax=Sphaerisporangium dianthi TaxID=1436120 RepID=A0ABV9C897_9ACTN